MSRSFFFIFFSVLFFESCQNEYELYNTIDTNSKYEINIDDALNRLDKELASIYKDSTLTNRRLVKKIEPIKYNKVAPTTRSNEIEVDNLLYVVEFENGQGSAILGADERVDDVFAILDKGVITIDEFVNSSDETSNNEISSYLANKIKNEAINQIHESKNSNINYIETGLDFEQAKEQDTIVNKSSYVYILTKWGQDSPYNDLCTHPLNPIVKCKAGCGPIAIGQILAHNQQNGTLVIDGANFNMSRIYCKRPNHQRENNQLVNEEVSRFIKQIGVSMNAVYGIDLTITPYDMMFHFLNDKTTYKNISDNTYDFNTIVNHIDNFNVPILVYDETHGWIIDAYIWKEVQIKFTNKLPNTLPTTYTLNYSVKKVHCNFGYDGLYDGYYTNGIFNISSIRTGENLVGQIGDKPGCAENDLGNNMHMVLYEK
ncbi:MAG: C10 family peptidase [Alistipes sp.]|nr:C10 family peptidase [Alistipes sp.]MBR3938343.1 C10 family peptidase [Bacteroidales bacterium]